MPGTWWRGSVHNHTVASDGIHTVAELGAWYREQGMDFVVITDHDVVADVSDHGVADLLVIPGAEIVVCWDEAFGGEVLCLGIDEVRRKGVHPQDVIDDALAQGGLPYISHPHLSGVYSGLMMDLEGLVGIEVYNSGGYHHGNRGFATVHLDDLMAAGKPVWALASGDRHRIGTRKPSAWVKVRAQANTRDAILDAMRQGHYYSTTGPEIHDIGFDDENLTVRCSGARRVTLSTLPWLSKKVDAEGEERLTEVTMKLHQIGSPRRLKTFMKALIRNGSLSGPKEVRPHVRVEIDDGEGGFAWSNPIAIPCGAGADTP